MKQKYIEHIENCFEKAYNLDSKINQEIKDMEGMTGQMTRHFYNNLLSMESVRYLEIGCWIGSSCCSALYENKVHAIIMDDFSGFGSPRDKFIENFSKFRGESDAHFIEHDCFKIDISFFKEKFNIYLFDADHSEESQFKALDYYLPCLEDIFIYIVDDWNWSDVRNGTFRAIDKNKLEVLYKNEIIINKDQMDSTGWWNGIGVFVLKK